MRVVQVVPSLEGSPQGDAELVSRVIAGDRWAKEALFGRHVRPVIRRLTRLVGDAEEAADLAQDTFVTAYASLIRLRDPNAFQPWLMQIAVRRAHDALRKRRLLRLLGLYQPRDIDAFAALAIDQVTPEQRAELALLGRVLERIPAAERIAWTLRHVEGERLEDVARLAGCSLATAKRRIKRADDHIRARVDLEDEGRDRP